MSVAGPDPRDQRISELEELVAEQARVIARLEQEVRDLSARLGNDSRNSHKPPSQDPKTRRKTSKSKRKRGGQPGHERASRALIDDPDKVVALRPSECSCCGSQLRGKDLEPLREQVFELPKIRPHVTEYQLHALTCACGTTTRASLPAEVRGGYGPRVTALVAHFTGALRLSKRMVSQVMFDLFAIPMAESTVCKVEQRASAALEPAHHEAVALIRTATLVHADETGWRENKRRAWLWLFATPRISLFVVDKSRGRAVVAQVLGTKFRGFLVSDRWGPYKFVVPTRRQLCWAHLLRDFAWMLERASLVDRTRVEMMTTAAEEIFHHWHRLKKGSISRMEFRRRVAPLRRVVEAELEWLSEAQPKSVAGKAREILKLRKALWTFVTHEGVEPTNNHGEQQLRHAVIWRKCSYGTDSDRGSRYVERVLTVVQSARKQRRNPLALLTAYVRAWFHAEPPPSLMPA